MKLGIGIGYSGAQLQLPVEKVQAAERLGYDSVWTAEAYGSDAVTPLAYLAAVTSRIRLGTSIMQLARSHARKRRHERRHRGRDGGRRPLHRRPRRFRPQIVEGWYGQPWGKPYWRLRDYVAIMRKIFARERPVMHEGREISLPYAGEGLLWPGETTPRSILHMNPQIPIWLGTGTEANVKLTAEIADGWLPLGYVPGEKLARFRPWLDEGFGARVVARALPTSKFRSARRCASPTT